MKNCHPIANRFKQLLFMLLIISGCKKGEVPVKITNPPVDGGGVIISPSCTASKTAAENIQIFPADNAWSRDISNAVIDPYNTQIIAGYLPI